VAASENVDALTMRELAERLGVRHSALYRWVRNRDELFDLISAALVDRVLERSASRPSTRWRPRLAALVRAMHDEMLALPGYATHLSRPHPHNAHSTGRLQDAVIAVLTDAGVERAAAEQSWYIVITGVVGWLAFGEQEHHLGPGAPRFEVFLDVLLRGLPAR
jgi:AcrR family transcriptional regulator